MAVRVAVHQPVPDRTRAVQLDSAPDLSCTDSTRAHYVDVEHQPTDLAGGVALRQVQLFTDREHAARQAEREQARNDARDAFQRDTILALKDAVADLLRMVVDLHGEAVNAEEKMGHGAVQIDAEHPSRKRKVARSPSCFAGVRMRHRMAR